MAMSPLCQHCHQRPATVFMTQIVENQATQRRYCEECARDLAAEDGLMSLPGLAGMSEETSQAISEALQQLPLDDILRSLFGSENLRPNGQPEPGLNDGVPLWFSELNGNFNGQNGHHTDDASAEFSSDEDEADMQSECEWDESEETLAEALFGGDEEDESDPLQEEETFEGLEALPPAASLRCPKCDTTWDRLKQDGRAGCAQCYVTFEPQLREVMSRLQRGEMHVGKAPRAREKRRRRLEHLRQKRDNRLEMLNHRLADAVREERYEDAAKLRDKIRIVASTIVRDDL